MTAGEYVWNSTHYANRKTLEARHIRGCRLAGGVTCGGAFRCTRCKKLVGWCTGGYEGSMRDGWCEYCWGKPMPKRSAER